MSDYLNKNDEKLLKECLKGSRSFQEALYRKYARTMYGICLSYANDTDSAQDILQDGFVKIFRKIKSYDGQGSFEGWMRRIITNTAIDHFRKDRKLNNYIEYSDSKYVAESSNIYQKLNLDQILKYIRKLPEGARIIFDLFAVEGYSHKEIAMKLNISEGTSKSQYNRARNLLQKMILMSEE